MVIRFGLTRPVVKGFSNSTHVRSVYSISVLPSIYSSSLQGHNQRQRYLHTLKTPKGTRDYNDKEMAIRDTMFSTIKTVFQRHGGVTIDTPVFELKEILAGKYGEESKLIYDLADQGGESCSLRYDLTVPFARYLAMHGKELNHYQLKRYQVAKVYRRDQPAMTKGRLREFYQCDFDISGTYDPMIPDAEILRILCESLDALDLGCNFNIKINHRKILDGIFQVCGVPEPSIRSVSSAIDKLDKASWDQVRTELIDERGLDERVADNIGHYVKWKGDHTLLKSLLDDQKLLDNPSAAQGLKDMGLLFDYLDVFDIRHKMVFDLSLARGLDYYTGIIYEAVPDDSSSIAGVGSIAAGGRYDELVGMFSGGGSGINDSNKKTSKMAGKKKKTIPCVGVSIGVERVFSILMAQRQQQQIKSNAIQVYVVSVGDGLLKERMQLTKELWDAGINATYMYKNKPKLDKQWTTCENDSIPLAVIIGKDELDQGQVRVKDMAAKDTTQGGGVMIQRTDMIQEVVKRLAGQSNID
ncbi:histidyl-tRNA synthetase [Absidia repens]|uniref:Histidine--tRNA ligase, mitochondrial n=1 Tax=Absidia repens TaxID=90262 RepID=A0A1X2ILM8_9FUNG|nr:histidyl-tRNA synthetase [Absidia repens]